MGAYPENVRKTKACLCEKFSVGGEFSQTKVADVCGSNPETPRKHLPLLQDKIICEEKKLVKVGKNRYTLVVPDDEFESPLEAMKKELMEKFHARSSCRKEIENEEGLKEMRRELRRKYERLGLDQMRRELREKFERLS